MDVISHHQLIIRYLFFKIPVDSAAGEHLTLLLDIMYGIID